MNWIKKHLYGLVMALIGSLDLIFDIVGQLVTELDLPPSFITAFRLIAAVITAIVLKDPKSTKRIVSRISIKKDAAKT